MPRLTAEWQRILTERRLVEDATISDRALSRVVGVSRDTVRRWRRELGVPPRAVALKQRRGTRPPVRERVRPREQPFTDERVEDEDELRDEHSVDEAPDDRTELGSTGELTELAINALQSLATFAKRRQGAPGASTGQPVRRSPVRATAPARSPADPTARLRAVSMELDSTHPTGPRAVALLVEAASLLAGGVVALRQYGQARGCRAEDVEEAERRTAGRPMIAAGRR